MRVASGEEPRVPPSTPEEFQALLRGEVDRWEKMVKKTGITVD